MRTIRIRQKDCVDCGEKISRDAKRCPYCTSYQDGSTQFHATIGQFAILIAFCVSAYAAYLAAEANRLATAGHIAPTLTRLELNKEALTLDIYNTGNLRDHLKRVAIEGIGFVSASSVNDSVDQYREAHGVIDFDFGRTEKRIDARDSTTAILELGTATRFSVDASYKKMDEAAHVSSFFLITPSDPFGSDG